MAEVKFNKLSDSISVAVNDSSLFLVNNEWTFKLPDGIKYELDAEFDGGYNMGVDLSGSIKTMVLKGVKSDSEYKFNVSLSPHYDLRGWFYTLDDCRNDNREEDDEYAGVFSHSVVKDEKSIYVDITSLNQWPLGLELFVRVRGANIQPVDFFTVLKNYTEDDFNSVVTKLIDMAESVKAYKSSSNKTATQKNTTLKQTNSAKDNNFTEHRAVMKTGKWSILVPEGFEFSDNPKKNGVSKVTGNNYELIIAKPATRKKVNFSDPYDNKIVFVTSHIGNSGLNGTSLDSDLAEFVLKTNVVLYSAGDWTPIIENSFLRVYCQPSIANAVFGSEVHNMDVLIITPYTWTAASFLCDIKTAKDKKQGEKLLQEMLQTILTPEMSKDWNKSNCIQINNDYSQNTVSVCEIIAEPEKSTPDEELYPHYYHLGARYIGLAGISVAQSSRGTQFACLPVKGLLKDKNAEKRILTADTEKYTLHENAKKFSAIFSVSKKAFNSEDDRENDILNSNLKKIEVLHALRSFAWSLMSYCDNAKKDIADVQTNEAEYICNFIAEQNNLNYQSESYFKTLCGTTDLHVAFLPENITQNDKNIFLPSDEDIEYHNNMKAKFPNFNEILGTVASLSDLRAELKVLLPVMDKLAELLLDSRDYEKPLDGSAADVLYAWCTLAIAAKGPFYTEDGPMMCDYSWLGTAKTNAVKTKKTESNTTYKATEKTTDRSFYNPDIYSMFECYNMPASRIKMLKNLKYREELDTPHGCDLMIKHIPCDCTNELADKAYRQYYHTDLKNAAKKFASVFRVDSESFNPYGDTEAEIYAGYIKHVSSMHALKSLATMIKDFAAKTLKNREDVTIEEICNMAYFIDDCGGSNFKPQSRGGVYAHTKDIWTEYLRNKDECNISYIGNFVDGNAKKTLCYLIDELTMLMPFMQKIYDYLLADRNRSEYLKSTVSKMLSAWCTLVIASDSSFEIVRGISDYELEKYIAESEEESVDYQTAENGIVYIGDTMITYIGDNTQLAIPLYIKDVVHGYHNRNNCHSAPKAFGKANSITFESADTNLENCNFSLNIKYVKFANGTKSLPCGIFDFNNNIQEIILPEGLEEIKHDAIKHCENLSVTIPASVKYIDGGWLGNFNDVKHVKAYRDSYAAQWLTKNEIPFETILSEEQKEADRLKAIREAEERERRRKEEAERIRIEAERRRREEEARIAEEKRIAAERKAAYEKLVSEKEEQLKIIAENKGLFGQKAKNRKDAKNRLDEILLEMEKYPELKTSDD